MSARNFASIQAVETNGTVTLFATADDGTVWSISGGVGNNWSPYSGSEWTQVPSLPEKEAIPHPKLKL